jgi:hypothetical protein
MVGGSMLGNALPDEGPTKKWQAHLGILIALLSTVPAMMAVFP